MGRRESKSSHARLWTAAPRVPVAVPFFLFEVLTPDRRSGGTKRGAVGSSLRNRGPKQLSSVAEVQGFMSVVIVRR